MASLFGYIRTSRHLQESVPGMNPASQELQLRRAGVPLANIHRDVGVSGSIGAQERRAWHQLNARLAGDDTLVVVASTASDGPGKTRYAPSANCGAGASGFVP